MLPLPGSPQATWSRYRSRLMAKFDGASPRVCISFFLFGLINNIYYVIILTAALDLVGPSIPKATVLLSCIIPGLATKIVTPYFIHLVPYSVRTWLFVGLSTSGMLAVALSPVTTEASSIVSKLGGIVLANMSCGAGEVSFLALTHYYGPFSLASWGSGTGAAGLVGAGAYALATNLLGLSVRATLLSSVSLAFVMLVTYFRILPLGALRDGQAKDAEYQSLAAEDDEDQGADGALIAQVDDTAREAGGRTVTPAYVRRNEGWLKAAMHDLQDRLRRAKSLVLPYMLPLFLVYLAEYTINQGVAPTLLFRLDTSPFKRFREFYPAYGTIYQLGVFLSRSSLPFIRVRNLYFPSWLQVLNLVVLTAHALYPFIPSVWVVFAIILWEGLLGGLVYVSTFAAVREEVPESDREFSLGAVTVSDSSGIFFAGILGAAMETSICSWQVHHGRDWCRQR